MNDVKQKIDEAIGWYGTAAIVVAYFLVSFGFISGESISFQILNVSGALGVLWISFVKKVWQTVTLESVWAVIGLVALVRIFM